MFWFEKIFLGRMSFWAVLCASSLLHAAFLLSIPKNFLAFFAHSPRSMPKPFEMEVLVLQPLELENMMEAPQIVSASSSPPLAVSTQTKNMMVSPVLVSPRAQQRAEVKDVMAKKEMPDFEQEQERAIIESQDIFEVTQNMKEENATLYDIYMRYYKEISSKISQHRRYPESAQRLDISGRVGIEFVIDPEGYLKAVALKEPCSHEILNLAAVQTIKNAAPFEKYPQELPQKNLRCTISIIYEILR